MRSAYNDFASILLLYKLHGALLCRVFCKRNGELYIAMRIARRACIAWYYIPASVRGIYNPCYEYDDTIQSIRASFQSIPI
jgi:hypothetical protein